MTQDIAQWRRSFKKSGWFGSKKTGFGVGPTGWQGWCTLGVWAIAMLIARVAFHAATATSVRIGLTLALFAVMALTYKSDPKSDDANSK